MELWTNFLNWVATTVGWRYVAAAGVVFVAILLSGIIAGSIGRGSTKRMITLTDRRERSSAVTALIGAARKASVWNTLSVLQQDQVEQQAGDADTHVRMLPVAGSDLAADWAAHEIAAMKKSSVSFGFEAEQTLLVVRDRLVEWQNHPGRAKRLFKADLDSWEYESTLTDQELVHQQKAWQAQQDETVSLDSFMADQPVGTKA